MLIYCRWGSGLHLTAPRELLIIGLVNVDPKLCKRQHHLTQNCYKWCLLSNPCGWRVIDPARKSPQKPNLSTESLCYAVRLVLYSRLFSKKKFSHRHCKENFRRFKFRPMHEFKNYCYVCSHNAGALKGELSSADLAPWILHLQWNQ